MLHITLENVRTFVGATSVELRPLTILTGENSSGKTTFLTVAASVCDPSTFPFAPGFNRPPFSLGTYDTIATYKGGKFGRAKSFSIGYVTDDAPPQMPNAANASYRNSSGQPELFRLEATRNGTSVLLEADRSTSRAFAGRITVRSSDTNESAAFSVPRRFGEDRRLSVADLLIGNAQWASDRSEVTRRLDMMTRLNELGWVFSPLSSTAIAPIRSQPERIYGQTSDLFKPTGDHIPFVLDRLLREEGSTPESANVIEALQKFGEESGLFRNLKVKKLGAKPEDPFQILVSMGGREANLVDVGYGVSQALPVVVESVLAPSYNLVLLQQPEVHLHPRGQAALGTFFSDLVTSARKRLVIETHSDFFIDRVRQEVAAGRIPAAMVALLFFERVGFETVVHRLELDDLGNITNAPPTYRAFFLEEELRLLRR
jgi:energy-coupling factor transporter ATP-binding protein EcfA2